MFAWWLSCLLKILIIIVFLLISVAFFTLAERKVLGAMQRRKGPNVVGIYGLLQPLSDGLKLFVKEFVLPSSANTFLFIFAPILTFIVSLVGWGVVPFSKYSILAEIDISLLYIFAVSALGIYGIIFSGWSSNSKYPFLGSLRSTAQMVSYELSLGFLVIIVSFFSSSFNLQKIIEIQENGTWLGVFFSSLAIIFFICSLAETNRHPFDLPEAEAELVSGYNVEYSSMSFALFSLGEYANMLMMCSTNVILFWGGWLPPIKVLGVLPDFFWFSVKLCFFVLLFIWARAALPRYRYDQLMSLGWKVYLPFTLSFLLFLIAAL